MDCLEQVALKVVDYIVLYPTSSLTTPHDTDDVSSYLSKCLGVGLLAWDLEDAIREGDGERIVRLWKFVYKFKLIYMLMICTYHNQHLLLQLHTFQFVHMCIS